MTGNYLSAAVICSSEQHSQILVHIVETSVFTGSLLAKTKVSIYFCLG